MQAPSSRMYVHYNYVLVGLIHIFMIHMILFKQTGWASPPQLMRCICDNYSCPHACTQYIGRDVHGKLHIPQLDNIAYSGCIKES